MPQIELLHTDCMEYMAGLPDKAFDLAIVDPPYGIGEDGRKDASRVRKSGRYATAPQGYAAGGWDSATPSDEYFAELRRVSSGQIVWGGNYFAMPASSGWIVWDKQTTGDFADCELAWTSFTKAVRKFEWLWSGFKMAVREQRIHPTQKPVALYRWLLKNYAKPGQRILDTHLGSGSIAIACDIEGFDLVGCEIDADYIKAARHRLAVHQSAPRLFEATPAGLPQQLSLGDDVLSSDGT